jgi:hypothetical protein
MQALTYETDPTECSVGVLSKSSMIEVGENYPMTPFSLGEALSKRSLCRCPVQV